MNERFVTVLGFGRAKHTPDGQRLGRGFYMFHSWSCLRKAKIEQQILGGTGNCIILRESTWKKLTGRA